VSGGGVVRSGDIAVPLPNDSILTSCNCDNRIAVFARTATGGAAPARVLELPGVTGVYSMLVDDAADTIWVVAGTDTTTSALMELPRGTEGSVAPLHAPVTLANRGHLARCN
jgi:hypothetical protein